MKTIILVLGIVSLASAVPTHRRNRAQGNVDLQYFLEGALNSNGQGYQAGGEQQQGIGGLLSRLYSYLPNYSAKGQLKSHGDLEIDHNSGSPDEEEHHKPHEHQQHSSGLHVPEHREGHRESIIEDLEHRIRDTNVLPQVNEVSRGGLLSELP